MSNVIRPTPRFSSLEMEAIFREAGADRGVRIEDLRGSHTLSVDFVYALLDVAINRAVISELTQTVKALDLSNHQVRQIAAAVEVPAPAGTPVPSKPAELNVREMRLIQGLLKDRSLTVSSRIADIEKSIQVE